MKEPGESSEYRQIDAKNYLTGNPVARTTKATIGSTKTVNGVTYVLDGWYPENAEGGAYGSTKIADNRWNNYTNYYVETSFRDIYNGGALVEAFIIKTEK